ncbi:MAG TPA: response regulator transcription factor [Chloroflexota bacterium]|nr:response regulator transcription factor [Chloroflexota bacterium]
MRILIVEDEERLVRLIERVLRDERYEVDVALDGAHGLAAALTSDYDLLILDVMLPGIDGLEICRTLRGRGLTVPVLMLTARDGVADRVGGLDAGADDYLVKPFAFAELLARLRALTRRRLDPREARQLQVEDLVLDLIRHEARRDGRLIELTAREFALLEFLMRHSGQVLSRTQILDAVWRYDTSLASNVVDTYVHYLREKIDRHGQAKLLRTVRGVGYAIGS